MQVAALISLESQEYGHQMQVRIRPHASTIARKHD
jgi:hypothetical protein